MEVLNYCHISRYLGGSSQCRNDAVWVSLAHLSPHLCWLLRNSSVPAQQSVFLHSQGWLIGLCAKLASERERKTLCLHTENN